MFFRAAILVIFVSNLLLAHKLNVFIYDENGTLYLQSYFTKSSPCKKCEVILQDKSGKEIVKTYTEDDGKVSIDAPYDEVAISVNAGMGHFQRIQYKFKDSPKKDPLENEMWYKLLLGLAIIGIVFFMLYLFKRKR